MTRFIRSCLIAMIAALVSAPLLAQSSLDDIKKRGTLIVGVKADYKPYGFRDPSGAIVGIEPDLAGCGQTSRRQARTCARRIIEPHAVPRTGQDRSHDRDDERQA